MWEIEFTDEFGAWWNLLSEQEQESIAASVELLRQLGPHLGRPHVDAIQRLAAFQYEGTADAAPGAAAPHALCLRSATVADLAVGGDKTGDDRFYDRMVPVADRLYDEHLLALEKEGLI